MNKKPKDLALLFATFFKIGLFTFGGGYAMISLLEHEFVEKRKSIEKDEMIDMLAISESTPGPLAINLATYLGYKSLGFWGSLVATVGVVVPSFVIIFLISLFLDNLLEYEVAQHAFMGINCAVGVLIVLSGFSLLKSMKKDVFTVTMFLLSFVAALCILFFEWNISTVALILGGALITLLIYAVKRVRGIKQ